MKLSEKIRSGAYDAGIAAVYYAGLGPMRERAVAAAERFEALFGDSSDAMLYSAPGRAEIGGNHTDHQNGRVLAAAISLDILAVVRKSSGKIVSMHSEGFDYFSLNLGSLVKIPWEAGGPESLIRGVASALKSNGFEIGGFDAYVTSELPQGSGLSSSAAFEVLVGGIFNNLYNNGGISLEQIAAFGKFAENEYFGKPCGLMDQMASASGGFVAIDFENSGSPRVESINFDLHSSGFLLCVSDTGGSHEGLTSAYAAITKDMRSVAAFFGKTVLREVPPGLIIENITVLRKICGDRALLRAMHFFAEDARAVRQADALRAGDFGGFLELVRESGRSSAMYLQNVSLTVREQSISVALALSDALLEGRGAVRVHGGGFAGTVLAFVPEDALERYRTGMESVFGSGSCHALSVRQLGARQIFLHA